MVQDIDDDTVDFRLNYDGSFEEPSVLPTRFPKFLKPIEYILRRIMI